MLFRHWIPWALVLALLNAGNNKDAKMAMMAITTSNSIKVNAPDADPRLRACLKNRLLVAQATRLCRPATRRTERERQFEPVGTAFSQRSSRQFRSAGRRPGRAGRPRHPFSKQALSWRGPAHKPCSPDNLFPAP